MKQLEYIQSAMKEMNKLRREVHHILRDAKRQAEKEEKARELEALEIQKRRLRMPNLLKMGDMFGLFKIKRKADALLEDDYSKS